MTLRVVAQAAQKFRPEQCSALLGLFVITVSRFQIGGLHSVHSDREDVHEVQLLRVLGEYGGEVAMNNMAKLPFELSMPISRARLKPVRGTGIVES